MRKTITENFAKSVINLHESGKLDDKPVDPTEIVPTQSDDMKQPDTTTASDIITDTNKQTELVDIADVGMDDVDVDSIVGTNDRTQWQGTPDVMEPVNETKPDEITNITNTQSEQILAKDNVDKKVNPSEIVG